jgi:hypothetical protein
MGASVLDSPSVINVQMCCEPRARLNWQDRIARMPQKTRNVVADAERLRRKVCCCFTNRLGKPCKEGGGRTRTRKKTLRRGIDAAHVQHRWHAEDEEIQAGSHTCFVLMGKRCWEGGGKADLNYGAGGHVAAVVGHGVLLGMACCWAWHVVGHGMLLGMACCWAWRVLVHAYPGQENKRRDACFMGPLSWAQRQPRSRSGGTTPGQSATCGVGRVAWTGLKLETRWSSAISILSVCIMLLLGARGRHATGID